MMHYHILDKARTELLPELARFKEQFYLAGGTALALYIGHRTSVDFDFFTERDFDTISVFSALRDACAGRDVKKVQEEKNTLTVFVDGVQISFFAYPYTLIEPLHIEPYVNLASMTDIGCMKLSAVVSRSSVKDYTDLYFILKQCPLSELLIAARKKFPDIDVQLILKSLVFFADVRLEKLSFLPASAVSFETVKHDLIEKVKTVRL